MVREFGQSPPRDPSTGQFTGSIFSMRRNEDVPGLSLPHAVDKTPPVEPVERIVPNELAQIPFRKVAVNALTPQQELLRRTALGVKEYSAFPPEQRDNFVNLYLRLLKRESNRQHFVGIPDTTAELKQQLEKIGVHGLAGYNVLGEIFGFTTIVDAGRDQSDSWIEKLVILNSLQNKKGKSTEKGPIVPSAPYHIGHDFLERIVEWGFTTPMHDGRQRTALHTALVMFVPKYDRVDALFTHFFGYDEEGHSRGGFDFVMRLPEQARVQLSNGNFVSRPISRFALYHRDWERERQLKLTK